MCASGSKSPEEEEHAEFQRWLRGLNRSQLLHAMEVCFQEDTAQSSSNSHEYDLLAQMIQLQSPPPTPVHPRAVFYIPASGKGKTDGRNEAARVLRNRRTSRPRFFRFFESKSISFAGPFGTLPPLPAPGGGPGRRRGGAGRRERNRVATAAARQKKYEVTARKYVTAWGDSLGLGFSEDVRSADGNLVSYSVLDKGDATEQGDRFYMSFCATSTTTSAADILRMLKVTSRGNFLAFPHGRQNPSSECIPAFCAPWLDPTSRWFSLPMYLASRFEVALWGAFKDNRRVAWHCRNRPLHNLEEKLSQAIIERTICKALVDTLRNDVIARDRVAPVSMLCDRILFDLLEAIEFWRAKEIYFASSEGSSTLSPIKRFLLGISKSPIIELGSTTDKLRDCVRRHMQAEISAQIGKDLMTSYGGEPVQSGTTPARRARKRKQKRKNGRKSQVAEMDNARKTSTFQDQEIGSSDEESDKNTIPLTHADDSRRLSFPDNGTPFVERNKNIVMCLSTLNDIVNEVFRRAGLEVTSDESDAPVVGSKQQKIATPKAKSKPKTLYQQQPKTPNKPPQNVTDIAEQGGSSEEKNSGQSNQGRARFSSQESEGDVSSVNAPAGSVDTFPSQYSFPQGFFVRTAPVQSNPWDIYHNNHSNNDADGWGRSNLYPPRDRSILTEFFVEQELADAHRLERITASSTAASLASSTDKNNEDTMSISDKFFISLDNASEAPPSDIASDIASNEISAEEFPALGIYQEEQAASQELLLEQDAAAQGDSETGADLKTAAKTEPMEKYKDESDGNVESRSVTPEAPATPSPRLSPILVSLDDLRDIRKGAKSVGNSGNFAQGASATIPSSLPSSPVDQSKRRLISSLSRENLRVKSFRDDHEFVRSYRRSMNQTVEGSPTYRNVAAGFAKLKVRATRSESSETFTKPQKGQSRSAFMARKRQQSVDSCARSATEMEFHEESQKSGGVLSYRNVAAKSVKSTSAGSWNAIRNGAEGKFASLGRHQAPRELCARSETAIEGHEEHQNWQDSRRSLQDNPDNNIMTVGKDGSTTITSAMSHRETEETTNLREERNTFSDMCLTLGAEVAKLKNQLAAQQGAAVYPAFDYTQGYVQPALFGAASFDPECMRPPFFQNGQAFGAMSDAGVHRGEYESQVSEDEEQFGKVSYTEGGRRLSAGNNTIAGSDLSIEPTNSSHALQGPVGLPVPMSKDSHDAGPASGLQTRLTQDILRFVATTDMQHRKLDRNRNAAVERMTRLVNTLWPRAQVKVYGSHKTGLCLPSSDLDFVICLPAVHKNAPAVAPGVLEGRNAINETSQKLLARKLKGESWIDPRSMKLIERTVVPVIKVATKDTRARTIQLDISFDSAMHHGLEAVVMVKQIVEELPMIRPLVLVLKQFLLDRALLTAYTGGLSSYCLFLMVARYLQEQPSSWLDCGSLLMGFLDFYGNYFDPRCTGISVGRAQYFTRANYVAAQAGQHMWAGVSPSPAVIPSPGGPPDFYRRNSFGENRSVDGLRGATGSAHLRPPHFQSPGAASYGRNVPQPAAHAPYEAPMDHAMPFTFDPLFVDDPLSHGNNVGRNAFRIFQVQRAFSDAHRALVASLEWDIQSAGDLHENIDYPLLKCLLQSEDVFYEL